MTMLILPFAIIILLAFALSVILKLKPMESVAAGVSSTIILLLVATLVSSLTAAVYIVCALSAALFAASVFLILKNKKLLAFLKDFFLNPGLIIFVLLFAVYAFQIYDNHVYSFDDFSYWGLASKAFLAHDGFKVPYGIIRQGQTNAMPVFNAFVTFFRGYNEGYLFCGMWLVYWAFLLLPISHLKWNRWKTAGIYVFLAYSILMFTSHEVRPSLYNDIMLAVIAGSLVAYYYAVRGEKKLAPIVILLGVAVLPHIKYFTGMAFAYFVLIACFFGKGLIAKFKENGKNKAKVTAVFLIPIVSNALQSLIRPQYIGSHTFTADAHSWCTPGQSLASALGSYVGLALLAAAVVAFVFALVLRKKDRRRLMYAFTALGGLAAAALCAYLYLNLDAGTKHLINAYIKNLASLSIHEMELYKIIAVLLIVNVLIYLAVIKEEFKKKYKYLTILFIAMALVYCVGMMATYTRFSEAEAMASASLDRYMSSYIVFAIISALGALSVREISTDKKKTVLSGLVMIYTVLAIMPAPFTLYNYEKNQLKYEQTGFYQNSLAADYITPKTAESDLIYIVNQGGSGISRLFMQYFAVTRHITGEKSLGPVKYEGDKWSEDLSPEEWSEYLKSRGIDYLYLLNIDDYFIETYGSMFASEDDIMSGELYKINYDGKVTFEKAG